MNFSPVHSPLDRTARSATKHLLARVARRFAPKRADLPLSTWGLSRDGDGALHLGSLDLHNLVVRRGSPLQVVDADRLARNAARFSTRPAGAKRGCAVFCSYKTSPVPGILRFLHARGVGAEVVTAYELWLALRLGVAPERIVFNAPAKTRESLTAAVRSEVGLINVNSRTEIAALAATARALGRKANVGIRVVVPGAVGGQLGERVDTGAAMRAFEEALRCPELRVVALHSHNNGEIASASQLDAHITGILSFVNALHDRTGLTLPILDVGGNLACPTVCRLTPTMRRLAVTLGCEPTPRPPDSVLSIEGYVTHVVHRVEEHFAGRGWPVPRIYVEPGRALTSNAQILLCKVVHVRDPDETGIRWAVLDTGVHLAEPLANEWHQLFPLRARPGDKGRLYRLTGPSCMLSDQLYAAWQLPELAPGDGLAIMDTGAYFVAFSAPFCGPRPAIVMFDGGREHVLRRAETFDDLIALDGAWVPRERGASDALGPDAEEDDDTPAASSVAGGRHSRAIRS